jgi:hypothetical protein
MRLHILQQSDMQRLRSDLLNGSYGAVRDNPSHALRILQIHRSHTYIFQKHKKTLMSAYIYEQGTTDAKYRS